MFTAPSQYVLNDPMSVAIQLRYTDANGVPVDRLYPTDYLSLVGSTTGQQVNQINSINTILNTYQVTLTNLQNQITAIQTSGNTSIPQVNAQCLSSPSNQTLPINVVTTYLVSNTCSYNNVLGTPTALAQSILAENAAVLNTLPAFSQNSNMAGLTGWVTSPLTVADSDTNKWLAYLDSRKGISTALAAVTPGCNQVLVDYQVTLPYFGTGFNLYFSGYTFIPSGYTDAGSTVKIVDSNGNQAINSVNLITQSATNQPFIFQTSGTTLQQNLTYTVYVNSNLTNSALGITCQKTVVHVVSQTSSGGSCCPDKGNYQINTSGNTATYTITTALLYTPTYASIVAKNANTASAMAAGYYLTYSQGSISITFNVPAAPSTALNLDWISFR